MKKSIKSKIDVITIKVITEIVIKNHIPYDEAERKFKQSVTSKILQDISSEFYLKDVDQIYHIFMKEQTMNLYLKEHLEVPRNNMEHILNQMIQNISIKMAILMDISIGEAYYSFIRSNQYHQLTKKDIFDWLETPDLIYSNYQKELTSKHTRSKSLVKK